MHTPKKVAWVVCLGMLFISPSAFSQSSNIQPNVSITSPQNNFVTNDNTLQITVEFFADANPNGKSKNTGNVKKVLLKQNGVEIASFNNPPNQKEGTHTFSVDLTRL